MKRKELTDAEKLRILELLCSGKNQEVVAEETHHRKAKIGAVLREFKEDAWERAKAFCGKNKRLLSLRDDYVDRMEAEAKLRRDSEVAMRQALGQLQAYSVLRGDWVELDDTPPPEI